MLEFRFNLFQERLIRKESHFKNKFNVIFYRIPECNCHKLLRSESINLYLLIHQKFTLLDLHKDISVNDFSKFVLEKSVNPPLVYKFL